MIEIERILCPVDFSDTSRLALEHAVAIARWYRSEITALHVVHPEVLLQPPLLFADLPRTTAPVAVAHGPVEQQLRAWLEPARLAGLKTDAIVDEGSPARRILERAQALAADLIVLGTHGMSGFERLVIGSVAEKVLRKAACPVMTVPPPSVTTARLPYSRLLCPVDFSSSSLEALRFAFSMAQEADAELIILHVFDWSPETDLLVKRFEADKFREEIEADARRRLDALITEDVRPWCRPTTAIAYGKPHQEIIDVAAREHADVIIIGVRGRNPVDLAIFGSTTNQVVRRATCPVLTLREGART